MSQAIDKTRNKTVSKQETMKRDGETNMAVGLFLFVLSLPVLLGTFWALDRPRAAFVNAVCGGVLFLVGAAVILYGWLSVRRAAKINS